MRFSFQSNAINQWLSKKWKCFEKKVQHRHELFRQKREQEEPTLNRRNTILLAFVLVLFGAFYLEGIRAPSDFQNNTFVTVPEGASLGEIAILFQEENVVRSSFWLNTAIRFTGNQSAVYAGDYIFARPASVFQVAKRITTGAYGLEPTTVTIPEGATVADMASIYEDTLFKFDPEDFLIDAVPLEGYLFPDTYHFLPNATHDDVIRAMRDNFEQKIEEFEDQIEESDFTLHEILILASIIEREAFNDTDRRLISGVLYNRLEQDMLLQVDATFVYTHGKGTYQITLAELRDDSNLYNTYVHKGLPPGPIAAVGYSSIFAALNPTPNDYIFYLADRAGTTYFSETYAEHLRKKRIYVD